MGLSVIDPEALPQISVGAINGQGPGAIEWRRGLAELEIRLRRLRDSVESPLNVNVIFLIPGPTAEVDFVGLRTGSFSRRRNGLIIQVALPEYPEGPAAAQMAGLLVAAIDLAELTARQRGIADSLESLRSIAESLRSELVESS